MGFVEPVKLDARGVRLVPLGLEHEAGLAAAAADGELWNLRITSVPTPDQTRQYILDALAMREAGHRFAFAVLDASDGTVLGSSSYHDILPAVKRVEIGWTWYAKRVWAGPVNPSCKRMLLAHGFESLGFNRMELKADARNQRSCNAMARFGAKFEGIHRSHMVRPDGRLRDTAWFSVIREEWPAVRDGLDARLAAFAS